MKTNRPPTSTRVDRWRPGGRSGALRLPRGSASPPFGGFALSSVLSVTGRSCGGCRHGTATYPQPFSGSVIWINVAGDAIGRVAYAIGAKYDRSLPPRTAAHAGTLQINGSTALVGAL